MRKVHISRSAAALATLVLLASDCYTGSARDFQPYLLRDEKGWIFVDGVRPLKQRGKTDCGPVALTMLLRYWGVETTPQKVRGDQRPGVVSAGYLRKVAPDAGLADVLLLGESA